MSLDPDIDEAGVPIIKKGSKEVFEEMNKNVEF